MEVVHHHRLPGVGHVSIERLFEEIRSHLPSPWTTRVARCPRRSVGLVGRLANMEAARRNAGVINHITGDVHYLGLSLPKRGLILTIHDCALLRVLSGVSREAFKQLWFSLPMRRSDVITTISLTMRNELLLLVGEDALRTRVVPNCVRSEYEASPKEFHNAQPVILQVGTGWNKNLEKVAASLRGIPCRLDIIGRLSELQHDILKFHGIRYRALGRVSDAEMLEAYRNCDLVMFASHYEGFGLPIIEAQAIGRPVITSNFGAMEEAAGEGALLVNPSSESGIRGAVRRLIGDPGLRGEVIARGFDNVKKYQPATIAREYAAIYAELEEKLKAKDGHGASPSPTLRS